MSARRCLEGTDRADVLDLAGRMISREMGVLDNKCVNLNSYDNYSSKIFETTKTRKMNFLLNPSDVSDVKPGIPKSTKTIHTAATKNQLSLRPSENGNPIFER